MADARVILCDRYPKMKAYTRFLENRIREHFNFEGVPIRVFFRKK